jgi:hypothetical protein
MDWFYAKDGQRTGPVSDSQLSELVRNRVLPPTALVWREGLEKWAPFNTVFSLAKPTAPQPGEKMCAVCERAFSIADLLRYEKCFVCADCKPEFFQRLREGLGAQPVEAWRSGKYLVTRRESRLPDRCIKCNAPANGNKLLRRLQWHPWWATLPLIAAPAALGLAAITPWPRWFATAGIISFFVTLLFALLTQQKADVHIGLCPRHWSEYHKRSAVVMLAAIFSIVAFIAGCNFMRRQLVDRIVVFSFLGIFIACIAYGMVALRTVRTRKLTKTTIWLRGVSPKYLAELPEWPGES